MMTPEEMNNCKCECHKDGLWACYRCFPKDHIRNIFKIGVSKTTKVGDKYDTKK